MQLAIEIEARMTGLISKSRVGNILESFRRGFARLLPSRGLHGGPGARGDDGASTSRKEQGPRFHRLPKMEGSLHLKMLPLVLLLACVPGSVLAEDGDSKEKKELEEKKATIAERVMVIGSASNANDVPGSAHYIGKEELERGRFTDIHRVLRKVPGVNIQEEDGYGLRPSIGMRGTGVERSQKITLLEDGLLIAPAPYAAPAAYYFPVVARMEGVEVRKGSGSIKQGPYTNGGSLNLLSRSIPSEFGGQLSAALGDFGEKRALAHVGDTVGRFGYMLESVQHQASGFKKLDGGGSTGFGIEDYIAKFRMTSRPAASRFYLLELKLGKNVQKGRETYLGLSRGDFQETPYRRYAGSQADWIDADQRQASLQWFIQASKNVDVTTTVYRTDFFRNWHKLGNVIDSSGNKAKISSVLDNPGAYAESFGILRGDVDTSADALIVRNNRRRYYSQGVQSVLGWRASGRRVTHQLELGIRIHEDQEDRFQNEEGYRMAGGFMSRTSVGAPGSQSNRITDARALAFFVQDKLTFGRWTLSPGIRFESIDYRRRDFSRSDPDRTGIDSTTLSNGMNVWIPGMGIEYALGSDWKVFGGVHKGFAPLGPNAKERVRPEESFNYEAGVRRTGRQTSADLVFFYSDYDNLLGIDTLASSGLGSGEGFNGGRAEIYGVEASLSHTAQLGSYKIPMSLDYTFTRAEFRTSFLTSFADWAPEVSRGDELPYLPDQTINLEIGMLNGRWGAFLGAGYVGDMRSKSGQGAIPDSERIPRHLVFDLTGEVRILDDLKLYARVRNLTNEAYVAALRPAGLRPGLPRTALVGLEMKF